MPRSRWSSKAARPNSSGSFAPPCCPVVGGIVDVAVIVELDLAHQAVQKRAFAYTWVVRLRRTHHMRTHARIGACLAGGTSLYVMPSCGPTQRLSAMRKEIPLTSAQLESLLDEEIAQIVARGRRTCYEP